ncbi:MAG: type IV toxin-antitoxin system AbiEi family antitoxin domain-containing protein, partial [Vicinamibacteria bacterium]
VERLRRGLYLVIPLEAGPERRWSAEAFVIASALVPHGAVAYWSAIRHWNWTEQTPRAVFVQTSRRVAWQAKTVLGVLYRCTVVGPSRFFGVRTEYLGGRPFRVTDPEKTVLDALDHVELSGGFTVVQPAVRSASRDVNWKKMDDYIARFPNRAALKRLGFIIESGRMELPDREARLENWRARISSGWAALDPGGNRQAGRINRRWRIRVNVPGTAADG